MISGLAAATDRLLTTVAHVALNAEELARALRRVVAWWATGRDPGPVLSSSDGMLPTING